jgi:hypothetical protein
VNDTKIWCTQHAKEFFKTSTEPGDDGTQKLVHDYWTAECGCAIEIVTAFPRDTN